MEDLLTNNIFYVYLLGTLVIINYEAFEKKQKIAIIYACSFGLMFNKDLDYVTIILLLVFILFVYEEYLNEDSVKIKYVTKMSHKVLDFLFMYIFQYKILYVLSSIVLEGRMNTILGLKVIKENMNLNIPLESSLHIISVLLLLLGIHKIFSNPMELKEFCGINGKFSEFPYYSLHLDNQTKRERLFKRLELVADMEDYTFFRRKKRYSSLSVEFISIVLEKKRSTKNIRKNPREKLTRKLLNDFWMFWMHKHKLQRIKRCCKRQYNKIRKETKEGIRKVIGTIKRSIRGYSTIEMQLIRILAYKEGLKFGKPHNFQDVYLIISRKVYEVIYAPVFFTGLKKYLRLTEENDYYKYYLVYIYLHTVQTNLNGKRYAPLDKIFQGVDVVDWPLETVFIIALGLSGRRIQEHRVDRYADIIAKYQLNRDTITRLIGCISNTE